VRWWPASWSRKDPLGQPMPEALTAAPQTSGYATIPQDAFFQMFSRRPPFSLFQADLMLLDQQVWFGVCVGNSPLMSAEVTVKSGSQEIKQFVADTFREIWSSSASKIFRSRYYGYCGYEVVYKNDEQKGLQFGGLLDRHPRDTNPIVHAGKVIGIAVRGMRSASSEPKEEPIYLKGMKGLWLTYDTEFSNRFGRPLLERAYPGWYDKATSGGAYDLRRLRCIKDAWIGDVARFPSSKTLVLPDGGAITGKDIMREIIENRASGGVLCLPSDRDENGDYLFDYEPPTTVAPSEVIDHWIRDLDWDIFDGLMIPREVVEAAASGSGFSGRSIPFITFLGYRDLHFAEDVRQLDTQIIRPLVWWRFGAKASSEYQIAPVPLLETVGKQLGGQETGGPIGGENKEAAKKPEQIGDPVDRNGQDTDGRAEGVEQYSIVHAPHDIEIGGKQFKGGEFIPNDALSKATPSQKSEIQRGIKIDDPKKEVAKRGELREARRADEEAVTPKGKTKITPALVFSDGSKVPSHIPAGKIPKAWKNVRVSADPDDDVWATGVDGKGRTKTVYSDSYEMRQAAIKFARNYNLVQERAHVQSQIRDKMQTGDAATKEAAACMWLIEEQATRPGSDKDTKAKAKAYGATTLRPEHVVESEDGVRLQFVGKEGVFHDHLIRNPELAKELVRRKNNPVDGKLFGTTDARLLAFSKTLDHGRFTPKDFRTLKATTLAIDAINELPKPKTAKERQKAMLEVAARVSHVLGNRPQQALESYINPMVFAAWSDVA
jgi:DNA topoisomerase I